ncbi:MAG: YjdF family protein [Gammaproteobacteria bacterium]|nr:YjdF family protein [Gammaproteobacteria bacterium]
MLRNSLQITVLFEDPFWVGILERTEEDQYSAAKIVFGVEPTSNELYHRFLQNNYPIKFSDVSKEHRQKKSHGNPKRRKRIVQREMKNRSNVSKAHAAIKAQHELMKIEKVCLRKEALEENARYKYNLKQSKRKAKHKGR